MKMIINLKKVLGIFLYLLSFSLWAQNTSEDSLKISPPTKEQFVRITYFGNEGLNRVFISCSYAERSIERILNYLRIADYSIDCRGGLEFGRFTPLSVNLRFKVSTSGQEFYRIKSYSDSNCYFDIRFIRELISQSKLIARGRSSRLGGCFSPETRYFSDIIVNP